MIGSDWWGIALTVVVGVLTVVVYVGFAVAAVCVFMDGLPRSRDD